MAPPEWSTIQALATRVALLKGIVDDRQAALLEAVQAHQTADELWRTVTVQVATPAGVTDTIHQAIAAYLAGNPPPNP